MRIPVIDCRGVPQMPCTPPKARILLSQGRARPKRDKLGLFYVQLTYEQAPTNQPLVVGIDPGAKWEGLSAVGTQDTVLNLMVEAPTHVRNAIKTRRTMRRARRSRKWRRPCRSNNRLNRKQRLPPSTRSRWEAKARIVMQLKNTLPLTDVVVEDVQAESREGAHRKWNQSFSPVQVGKHHLYRLLAAMGLRVHVSAGWQTNALREQYALKKTKNKAKQSFDSHCVDAWCLAASISGANAPPCTRLWYVVPTILHRRQLHRMQPAHSGARKPYGGTRTLEFKRGTLVRHPKYGLCIIGGLDRPHGTISLHDYRTNKRLTQRARVDDCRVLTWVAFRSWVIPTAERRARLLPNR